MRKVTAIIMALFLLTGVFAAFSACQGGSPNPTPHDEAIFSTGLTGYQSLEAMRADGEKAVTRRTAYYETAVFSGIDKLSEISEEDITKQLEGFRGEAAANERKALAIAMRKRFIVKQAGGVPLDEPVSGAELAYTMVYIAGYFDELEEENAAELFGKYINASAAAKAAVKKETVTAAEFYEALYGLMQTVTADGVQIGNRLVTGGLVDEKTALAAGLSDGYFAKRIDYAAAELEDVDRSGVVGVTLASKKAAELRELLDCYRGGSAELINAVNRAKRAVAAAEKDAENYFKKLKREQNGSLAAALAVGDRKAAVTKIAATAPTATKTSGEVTLENAYSKFTFSLKPFAMTGYYNKEVGSEMLAEKAPVFSFEYNYESYSGENCEVKSAVISGDKEKTLTVTFKAAGGALEPVLTVKLGEGPEASFDFTVKNLKDESVSFKPVFPDLGTMMIGDNCADDVYFYPRKGGIISDKKGTFKNGLKVTYGGGVTFPVVDLFTPDGKGGSYLILKYDFLQVKDICFVKDPRYGSKLYVSYYERDLEGGDAWTCATAAVGSHPGDWYNAITAYKDYVATWYDFSAESPALQGNIQFKQVFVKQGTKIVKELSEEGKSPSELVEGIFDLGKRFAGYQTLHWFDWWNNLGDYDYYAGYGGFAEVRNVADVVHTLGKKFSLYTEGILANTYSNVYLELGNDIYRLTKDGKLQVNNGSFDCTCHLSVYGDIYVDKLTNIIENMPVDIVYLDQFGNQTASECYNPKHDHADHYCVLAGQIDILKRLRENINAIRPGVAVGGEYPMSDYASQYTSYVFNYNNSMWFTGLDGVRTEPTADLYTFLFPDVKLYNITIRANNGSYYDEKNNAATDYIEDLESLKLVFFNGEGRWHDEGYTGWPEGCEEFVCKSQRAVEAFEDVFMGKDKTPLLPTDKEDVFVNRFVSEDGGTVIFTVLNKSGKAVENVTFPLENAEGYAFFELLSDKEVNYKAENGLVTVAVTVADGDVAGIAAIKN